MRVSYIGLLALSSADLLEFLVGDAFQFPQVLKHTLSSCQENSKRLIATHNFLAQFYGQCVHTLISKQVF